MNGDDASSHLEMWRDRLQDLIDGALDSEQSVSVSAHIQECKECSREHAQLSLMDEQLKQVFSSIPALSADFAKRVFTSVEATEAVRKSAAKQRAELEFQNRMHAFGLDWRDLWQRHMGSVVAALSVFAAVIASLGAVWGDVSETLLASFPFLGALGDSAALGVSIAAIPITLSAAALWILRTKTR